MTVAAVAIGSFLLLLVVAYLIARPLFAPDAPVEETEESKLLEDKRRLLTEIRELDMDFATGKLSEDDYLRLRAKSLAEAAATMRAIAESGERSAPPEEEAGSGTLDLEPGAEDGHAARQPSVALGSEDQLEREIAARKRAMREHGCPDCGAVVDPGDRFCRVCGADLVKADTGGAP